MKLTSRPVAVVMAFLIFGATTFVAIPPAAAAPCAGQFTVTPTHSPVFFSDFGDNIQGMYLGYKITNTTGATIPDLWVSVDAFSGVVGLAPNEDGIQHFGAVAAGASVYAYFYVTASALSNAAQPHTVNMFSGPAVPANEICDSAQQLSRVINTISANANKVTAVTNGPNPQQLGGLMTITVTGDTGQVGGAGIFAATPASLLGWPANAYQMVDVSLEIRPEGSAPGSGTTYDDILYLNSLGNQKFSYTIVYTFVAQGATTAPTAVAPINNISSGNPVKHTSTGTSEYQAIPPLTPAVNRLSLTKSVAPAQLVAGGKAVYTVTIRNDGSIAASLDALIDTLPSTPGVVTFDPTVTPTFNGIAVPNPIISGQRLTFSGLFTAPAGGTSTLRYGVNVPNVNGSYVNSVVGHMGPGPVIIDTTRDVLSDSSPAKATVTVGPLEADLGITKTDGVTTIIAGDATSHTYTVTVSNNGPTAAQNVVVTDTWPAGLTQGTVAASQGSCAPGPSFSCALGTLNAGTSATITVGYTVPGNAAPGSVTNSVSVTSSTNDPGPTPNTASDTNTIVKAVSLAATKTFADAAVPAGTAGHTFSIDVTNTGPSDATNVTITDTVGPALTVTGVDCAGGTNNSTGNAVACTLPTLAGGASATVVVSYDVPASTPAGNVTNTATVQSDSAGPVNASDTVDVTENVVLEITKAFADPTVTAGAGSSHTFDIVVVNTGTTAADNAVITDTVDPSLSVIGTNCSPQGGTDGTVGNAIECSGLTIAPSAGFTLTVTYVVDESVDAQLVSNTASVASDEQVNTGSSPAVVEVIEDVALSAAKTFVPNQADAGTGGNTFTVEVTNGGVSDADNVVISDIVDPILVVTGTDCTSIGGVDGTAGNDVSCVLPTLAAGASSTLTVTFAVPAAADASIMTNTAQAASDEFAAVDSNDASLTINENVLLSADKAFVTNPVVAGSTGNTFTIAVTNSGSSDADNVILTDIVSPNLSVTSTDCAALGGADNTIGNSVRCDLSTILASTTVTLTVSFAVPASTDTSTVLNTAQVASDEQAGTDSNTTSVDITEDVMIGATKAFDDPVVVAGGSPSSFTVTVTNTGISDAENVTITDAVDPALTVTGTNCAGIGGVDATSGNIVDCTIASLGGGASVTLIIDFLAAASVDPITVLNTAEVASDEQTSTTSNTAEVEIVRNVGLQVAKTFTPSSINGGTSGNQFTISVTNTGVSDAVDVVLTDVVDSRLNVTAVSCGGGIDIGSGQNVSCEFGSLSAGATATIVVTFSVGASEESATIVNTATATDIDGNIASGTASLTISENVVLAVTKLPSPPSVIAGTTGHRFSITVRNLGTSDADSVTVTDTFDGRLTVTAVDCGGGANASAGQDVECSFASLAPGGSAIIVVTYEVDGAVTAELVPNTALAADADGNAATGQSSVQVVTVIDLDAVKEFSPATAAAGSVGNQFTLRVENNGISDAVDVRVTDTVDPRLTVRSIDCGMGADTSILPDITCTFPTVAAGDFEIVTVTYDIASSVAPTSIGNRMDVLDFAGNTAASLSSVNVFGSVRLSASKAFSPATVTAGSAGHQFTISVTNDGLSDTSNVRVLDTVDARLSVTSVSCPGGTNNSAGQIVDCTFDPLLAGGSIAAVVTYSVADSVDTASVANVVSVADANGNVGSAFASVNVAEDVSLSVNKNFTQDPVQAGTGPHSFSIAVTNSGTSSADNVAVTDTVHTGLVVTSVVADGGGNCAAPSNAVNCTIPTLAPGAVATVTVEYTVPSGPSTTINNTARATSDETPTVSAGSDTVAIVNPAVSITKTADQATVNPGDPVTYAYVVSNSGDTYLADVTVVDDAGTPGDPGDDITTLCDSGSWPVAPGGSVTCSIVVNLADDTTNTAVVTANPVSSGGGDLAGLADVTGLASETVNVLITGLTIVKSTSTPIVPTGGTANYAYLVENVGDDPLTAVDVVDDRCSSPIFASVQVGNGDATLDAAEIWQYTCSVAVTGDVTNIAYATAVDELSQTVVSPTDSARVDVIDPAIELRKSADAGQVTPGSTITYTIEIENSGDDNLTNVSVTDDTCSGLALVGGDGGEPGVLEVGEIWTYSCSVVAGVADVINTADVSADDSLGQSTSATDSVTVLVNEPPVAGDDTASTNQEQSVAIDLLTNDSDPDGTLNPASVNVTSGPTNGVVSIDTTSGVATYTPDAGFFGSDLFEYEVCDNDGACASASVTVEVNGAPITAPDSGITNQGTPLNLDVLANDTDPEGDVLTVTGFPSPPINGTATIEPDGTVTYTPNAGFIGTETFTYEVCDPAGACSEEFVSVAINSTPVANNDTAGTLIDTPVTIDVAANDTDADNNIDPTSVTILTAPNDGTVSVDPGSGEVTYIPGAGFVGDDTFVYQICDTLGACDTAVVAITVSAANTPPTAVNDTAVTDVDVPVTVDVLANDTDAESNLDPTSVSVISGPTNGTAAVDPVSGAITYTPNPGYNGPDQLVYEVCDLIGECDTAVLDLLVNVPPAVNDDSAATNQDSTVTIDVLANDADADGTLDPATVLVTGGPTSGTVTVDPATGAITYTPDPGFFGSDSFTYQVCDDAGSCAEATVAVEVNGAPQTSPDADFTNAGTLVSIDVLGNDSDPEGDPMTLTAIPSGPTFGTAVINAGQVDYTPAPGFFGDDTFTYEVCDDRGACSVESVTVTVDGAPIARDDAVTTAPSTPVSIDVLANDSDPEGALDTTSVLVTSGPTNGTTTTDPATGAITYTPDPGFSGTDSFVYEVCDSANPPQCDSATVSVGVDDPVVNDPPVAVADTDSTQRDTAVTTSVLANDLDPENGRLTVNSLSGVTAGAIVVINPDGTITYTPPPGFIGVDSYTYEVCDDGTPVACDFADVVISVNAPPTAVDDTAATNQESAVTVPVLANDSDADGFLVPSSVSIFTSPANGTASIDPITGDITYTPAGGFFGSEVFTYRVCDNDGGCSTASITVDVNARPLVVDPLVVASDGSPVTIDVVASATDPDGTIDPSSVSIVAPPSSGTVSVDPTTGEITFTPAPGFIGTAVITYQLCDNDGACVSGTIEVIVNGPPLAVNDAATTNQGAPVTIGVAANDTDPDGLDLGSVTVTTPPANGSTTVNADGTVTYLPDPGFFGIDAFTYQICDNLGACSTANVVVDVNGAPIPVPDAGTVDAGKTLNLRVLANDTDPEGDPISVAGFPTPPSHGSVVIKANGSISYTPSTGFVGIDSFTYLVCDDRGACSIATVSITVNGLPTAVDDAAVTSIGVPVDINVLANDVDPESALDPSTVTVVSGPSHGSTSIDPTTGVVTYTPAPGFTGSDIFTYRVCDDAGACSTAKVTVEVGDPPPLGADDFAVTDEDTAVTIAVLGNDADPNGEPLFIGNVTSPSNGAVTVNADGTITYLPAPDFFGEDTFTYEVCDFNPSATARATAQGTGTCDVVTVTITVRAVNDAPVFTVTSPITVTSGGVIPPLTATDVEGSVLTFTLIGGALPPGVTLNPDGSFTGTSTVLGVYTFTVQVCDSDDPPACSTITLTLVIQALPFTGAPATRMALVAVLLLLFGAVLVRIEELTLQTSARRSEG